MLRIGAKISLLIFNYMQGRASRPRVVDAKARQPIQLASLRSWDHGPLSGEAEGPWIVSFNLVYSVRAN